MSHEQDLATMDPVVASSTKVGSIAATIVPESRRMDFLPSKFGSPLMLKVEMNVYAWMERLCKAYHGGYWNYVELSNGGGYMVPTDAQSYDMCVEGNHFDGRVSADTAGIIATTFALNSLVWQGHDALNDRYEQLLEFVSHHPDRGTIVRALD